jgi:hypothetical protein
MEMTKTSYELYQEANALYHRVASGHTNETPIMAWAGVCRACAKASNATRNELQGYDYYTRLELNFFNNLDRIWSVAKAQVETRRLAASPKPPKAPKEASMNDATLHTFRALADAMSGPEPRDWQWIGPHMSQRMFGITEQRAKNYAARHGGEASRLEVA